MEITLNSLKINYIVEGEGQPVLLLHGWGSSVAAWRGIINALKDRCKFYAFDFPGCGNSQVMDNPWTVDDYCNLTLEFIKAMGLQNPIMFGHSHGGRVTMKLCGDGLVSPKKIVLFDAAGLIPKKSFKQKFRAFSFKAIKKVLTLPVVKNYTEGLLNQARAHYGSADYNAAPPVLRQTLVNLVNQDIRDVLPSIKASSLLIWGENDTATPLADAKTIESLIPDAGLCVLKGCGHFSFVEKPFDTYAILKNFLG